MENLGKEATDKITGFKGIITGFAKYIHGNEQYEITARSWNPDKVGESQWFDTLRIKILGPFPKNVQPEIPAKSKPRRQK